MNKMITIFLTLIFVPMGLYGMTSETPITGELSESARLERKKRYFKPSNSLELLHFAWSNSYKKKKNEAFLLKVDNLEKKYIEIITKKSNNKSSISYRLAQEINKDFKQLKSNKINRHTKKQLFIQVTQNIATLEQLLTYTFGSSSDEDLDNIFSLLDDEPSSTSTEAKEVAAYDISDFERDGKFLTSNGSN